MFIVEIINSLLNNKNISNVRRMDILVWDKSFSDGAGVFISSNFK
jgi:small-conductance mechanosensitive channel